MPTKSRNCRSPKKLARRMKPTRRLSRRKGSGKKGSARARIPKKLRGGVTRRRLSQLTQQELFTALRLLPADVVKELKAKIAEMGFNKKDYILIIYISLALLKKKPRAQ